MANELNEEEGFGMASEAAHVAGTEVRDEDETEMGGETVIEEEEGHSASSGWMDDAVGWLASTVRERPLEALLIVAGASLVTGLVTGTLLRTSRE